MRGIFLLLLLSLSSCSKQHPPIILDIPHIQQTNNYSCATTCLAMVISYFERKKLDPDYVWKISKSDVTAVKTFGNDVNGLKRISDTYGYKSEFRENMSVKELENLLDNGIPVVLNILQKYGKPGTHSVVVVGYDKKTFFINDPAKQHGKNTIKHKQLDRIWSAHVSNPSKMTHKSGFVVYPSPSKL